MNSQLWKQKQVGQMLGAMGERVASFCRVQEAVFWFFFCPHPGHVEVPGPGMEPGDINAFCHLDEAVGRRLWAGEVRQGFVGKFHGVSLALKEEGGQI